MVMVEQKNETISTKLLHSIQIEEQLCFKVEF